jgi:uncharacterized cysteine cluster protein YcgN (CxxCxxCC family)
MTKFWETKSLAQMSQREWESLCDGCARCCMIKLQDEDTDEVHYTSIVCNLLDHDSCQCTAYSQRHARVKNCVVLTIDRISDFHWLPKSCAYRTLAEGRPLEWWHPLVSGSAQTVHQAEISVQGKVIAESQVDEADEQDMIIRWVEV